MLLLAFANDKKQPLDQLEKEQQRVMGYLRPLQAAGHFITDDSIFTTDGLRQSLLLYGRQVALFHFAGHAGSQQLVFPDNPALADGVAALLGIQTNLGLVFLNGCSTEAQVDLLLDRGVPAVIATKIPVGDNRACLFAESFYRKLTAPGNEGTIQEAFEAAVGSLKLEKRYAELQSAQGPTRCGMTLSVSPLDDPTVVFEWGLYFRKEKEQHVKTWHLPDQSFEEARSYGRLVDNAQFGGNDKLTFTLYRVLLPYFNPRLSGLDPSLDMQEVQVALVSTLPYPIGKQFNELFAFQIGTPDVVARQSPERLNKLIDTFDVLVDLLAYVMIAQLWDAINDTSPTTTAFELSEPCRAILWEYLIRSASARRKPDLLPLIREIRIDLEKNRIPFFIEELRELKQIIETDQEFRLAYDSLQALKEARADHPLDPNLCGEAEDHLCVLFRRLGFCAKYDLASVKHIQVKKLRNNEAEFDHQWARPTTNRKQTFVSRRYKNYTDPNSVVIWREEGNNRVTYLNLSPFVIDAVALGEGIASDDALKVYFFDSYDPDREVYSYKNISNLPITPQDKLETLEVGAAPPAALNGPSRENNYDQVKKTFDAFTTYFRP